MKPVARLARWGAAFALLTLTAVVAARAEQYSHVRIVRLSFAEGTVTVLKPDVGAWSKAPVNTPMQEGFKLSTSNSSYAEVEFENGSTARIGESSLLEFNQLALTAGGEKLNRMTLVEGYGTFHVFPAPGDVYEVTARDVKLEPQGLAEFRADVDPGKLRVEVFRGSVTVSGPEGSTTLTKNKVLELNTATEEAYQVTRGITKDEWDNWVAERDGELSADKRAPSPYRGGPSYGWSDLNGYGTWSYYDGYGYGWAPNLFNSWIGWSPFTYGQWAWYPTLGYTWIGSEPWGWLPYHYGNWFWQPAWGWFWIPGGFSNGWCPATVTWYQGPGWVGWMPSGLAVAPSGPTSTVAAGSTTPSTPKNCPARGCVNAVSADAFRNGQPVTLSRLLKPADLAQISRVPQPDLLPTTPAMLPGRPVEPTVLTQSVSSRRATAQVSDLLLAPRAAAPHIKNSAPLSASASGSRAGLRAGHSTGLSTGLWHARSAPASSVSRSLGFGSGLGSESVGRTGARSGGWSARAFGGGFSSGSHSAGASGGGSHSSSGHH